MQCVSCPHGKCLVVVTLAKYRIYLPTYPRYFMNHVAMIHHMLRSRFAKSQNLIVRCNDPMLTHQLDQLSTTKPMMYLECKTKRCLMCCMCDMLLYTLKKGQRDYVFLPIIDQPRDQS